MTILTLISFICIGCIAGLLSGLFGIGGGVVTVPCLALVFYLMGFEPIHRMQMAIGTSLASMVITTASSTWAHDTRNGVLWKIVIKMLPGIILGCITGSILSHKLTEFSLEIFFGLFAIAIGIYSVKPYKKNPYYKQFKLRYLTWTMIGFFISIIAALLGIGGGIITVPLLVYLGYPDRNAIGTSVASGFIITLLAALLFLYLGLSDVSEAYSIGYLYLPAFFSIGVPTVFTAIVGAKLAHTLPIKKLRLFFGIAMIIVGIIMVI